MTDAAGPARELKAAGSTRCRAAAPRSCRGCAEDLPRQVRRRALPGDPPHRARPRHAHQRDDAVRHIETFEERVDHMLRRARCRTRPAASRRSSRSRFIPTTTRCESCRRRRRRDAEVRRGGAPDARQRRSHQGLLDFVRRRSGADGAVVRRRRSRRHRSGRDDLPHGRIATPTALSTGDIEQLIWDAGREPIERDTLYNVVRVPSMTHA